LSFGDYFAFRMYAILGPRIGSVLTTLSPAAALLAGFILLDEHINRVGIAGMLIHHAGCDGNFTGRSERKKIPDHGHGSKLTGIITGVLAAVFARGVGLVLSKKGMFHPVVDVARCPLLLSASVIGFLALLVMTMAQRQAPKNSETDSREHKTTG
jgi:drug/metabolite transporter (DMT)-like permease